MAKPPTKPKSGGSNTPDAEQPQSLEQVIARKLVDVVPRQRVSEIAASITTVVEAEYFQGPIAHPRHLREYEAILPGSADRIVAMAEKRNDHIIDSEAKILEGEIADRTRGMHFGALLFAALIASALVTALLDKSVWIVAMFLGASAIGAISLFIKGRNGR